MNRFAIAFLLSVQAGALAAPSPLEERFRSEYPPAAEKLRQFYLKLRVSCTKTVILANGDIAMVVDYQYAGNGDMKSVSALTKKNVYTGAQGETEVLVYNPRRSFRLNKGAGDKEYTITALTSDKAYSEDFFRLSFKPYSAPYCFFDARIADFIRDSQFSIKSIQKGEDAGDKTIKVVWEHPQTDPGFISGSFTFLPEKTWALRAFDCVTRLSADTVAKGPRGGEISYGQTKDGVPLVKEVQYWEHPPGDSRHPVEIVSINSISSEEVPPAEFELSHYGLSTVHEMSGNPLAYNLLLISLAALVIGLGFRVLQRRAQKR